MRSAEKVAHGFALAQDGMAELRIEQEHLAAQMEHNRQVLVGGEYRAVALRFQALRSRRPRHLMAGEVTRAAPPLFDGVRSTAALDARTASSLATMRLVPTPRPVAEEPRGWVDRLLGRRSVPVLCPHCLASPCTCSPRIGAAPTEAM